MTSSLTQVGAERFAGQVGGEHGVACGEAPGGVREHADLAPGEHVEDGTSGAGVDAAERDGHDGGLGGDDRPVEQLEARNATAAQDQS